MNREQAKELLPIIQAFADGKTIQYYSTHPAPHWEDILSNERVDFSKNSSKYRIKPEPKYRPFKDAEECWQEMQKHQPFGWLKHKEDNVYSFISKIDKDCCYFAVNVYWGFDTLFKTKTFIDGTPFGIKEE